MGRKQTTTPEADNDAEAWARFSALLERAARPISKPEPAPSKPETSGPHRSDG
jgi:hypothetical protein